MTDIKSIVEDIGIKALENSVKIASLAVISDSGELIYQTSNMDLTNQTQVILNVIHGEKSFNLNGMTFLVEKATNKGIIATEDKGMGHILIISFQGGFLISYAMPQADVESVFSFLKSNLVSLNGIL